MQVTKLGLSLGQRIPAVLMDGCKHPITWKVDWACWRGSHQLHPLHLPFHSPSLLSRSSLQLQPSHRSSQSHQLLLPCLLPLFLWLLPRCPPRRTPARHAIEQNVLGCSRARNIPFLVRPAPSIHKQKARKAAPSSASLLSSLYSHPARQATAPRPRPVHRHTLDRAASRARALCPTATPGTAPSSAKTEPLTAAVTTHAAPTGA